MSKSTGSYYTPKKLTLFMWQHALKNIQNKSTLRVLEPSCGDGIFLRVASEYEINKDLFLDAVEISPDALKKTRESLLHKNGHFNATFIEDDFLKAELSTTYDLIIGNPPYIGRKLLSEQQKEFCKQIHIEGGLGENGIRNIWTAFLIKATSLLNTTGVLALVLPGELLQVSYAEKIRSFLEDKFKSIEILTFQELVFPALGQDVVVVFAYKESPLSGISYTQVDNIDSLDSPISFPHRTPNTSNGKIKWSNFVLDDNELEFLSEIAQKVKKVSDYCTSTPGIVTAANEFFIVNEQTVSEHSLEHYCEPILQKAEFVENAVIIDNYSFEKLKKANKPCYLINLGAGEEKSLPLPVQNYIQKGVEQDFHKRYKCRHRTPWYNIPSVWTPEGVIFKRCHLYPKLLKNEANVLFTDSAYRIRPHKNFNINSLIYSFYNSLTLTFSELNGRYYGGGVLELTPKEFQGLPLPYKSISQESFLKFKEDFASNESIEQILYENDARILKTLELSSSDLERLRLIRQQLLARRLKNQQNGHNASYKEH